MERVLDPPVLQRHRDTPLSLGIAFVVMVALLIVAPFVVYPVFLMKALCFALFACAFNLLIGYVGLISFGHAMFFGWASYLTAYAAKIGSLSIPYWFGHTMWLVISAFRRSRRQSQF